MQKHDGSVAPKGAHCSARRSGLRSFTRKLPLLLFEKPSAMQKPFGLEHGYVQLSMAKETVLLR